MELRCSSTHPTTIAFLFLCVVKFSIAEQRDIYNTKLATSDLQWESYPNGGWEEVSSLDESRQSTIRSYQICIMEPNSNFWIRSPYIPAHGGKQIHLEVEYSISRCDKNSEENIDNSQCKETFNIFYYGSNSHVASSTFPPWRENPYVKIDTVAANNDKVNNKTFSFGPLNRNGFYIALQDQGACIALIALRAYYYYCPKAIENLVSYPTTVSEVGSASLVTVKGHCVANSVQQGVDEPHYRCSSRGQWQIATGSCVCDEGYEISSGNTQCLACKSGTYKLQAGREVCIACPANSGVQQGSNSGPLEEEDDNLNNQCPCFQGYARAADESISTACTKPPSQPLDLRFSDLNATSVNLDWKEPENTGGRNDTFYTFKCQSAVVDSKSWFSCSKNLLYLAPSLDGKYFEKFVQIVNLYSFRSYKITVVAENGASLSLRNRDVTASSSSVEFDSEESTPSKVGTIRATDRSSKLITLIWYKPHQPNGRILDYEVEYKVKGSTDTSAETPKIQKTVNNKITLIGLREDTEYEIRIRARTSAGYGVFSDVKEVKTISSLASADADLLDAQPPESNPIIFIILGVVGAVLLFILIVVIQYKRSRKLLCLDLSKDGRKTQHPTSQNGNAHQNIPLLPQEQLFVDLPPRGQQTYVDYSDPITAIVNMGREVDPDLIKIEEVIGKGEFAEVCRGQFYLEDTCMDVAIKRLKNGASGKDQRNFLKEAATMAQFKHPNVIELKGVVTKSVPAMIVTEYMKNGSLDQYLLNNKGKLSVLQLVKMLHGIVNGMSYLSKMKYIHRDLAARNVLVDSDLFCKVSDFGLSRTLENDPHATYTTQGGKIAIRWTAPESILYRKFTSASDVWSYGILAWEVMSYGEKPYWDMQNDDVIKNVQQGMRLPSPTDCPKILHKMMLRCWSADSTQRPEFSDLAREFDVLLRQPSLLFSDAANHSQVFTLNEVSAAAIPTTSLGHAVDTGEIDTVNKFLEIQDLGNYVDHFKQHGIDNLEKVSSLTINDLKALGIEVKLHISTLEDGIRTLKRHLSTCTSPPASARASINPDAEDEGVMMDQPTEDAAFQEET